MLIRLGHSLDPDDAFMFLEAGEVDTRGFEFEHVLRDIQTLNEWALEGRLEATAISLHAYPFVQDRYVILPHGASMGARSGPVVVAREPITPEQLLETEVLVQGRMTTAFLVLRLYLGGEFRYREAPHDQILAAVASGDADAGLVVDGSRFTLESTGLRPVVDLGDWWLLETGLPLPLGVNVARRDLGDEPLRDLSDVVADSIAARPFAHPRTQDYGDEGREAVRELLLRGQRAGAFEPVHVEFV